MGAVVHPQCLLVRGRLTRLHRQIGVIGFPVALGILVSGVAVARWVVQRDLATKGEAALSEIVGVVTGLSIFAALVAAAIIRRRRSDWHKRLMLLATVAVLWPAWFRIRHVLPFVPDPEIWLGLIAADLPILIAAVRDYWLYGRVHPAWAFLGTALFVEQSFEILAFDSPPWRSVGGAIYALLD